MKDISIAKLITIGYPALILLGFIRLFFFYNYYDIDILPYLEISEILISFLNRVVLFIIPFAFFTITSIVDKNQTSKEIRSGKIKRIFRSRNFKSRFGEYLDLFLIEYVFFIVIYAVVYSIANLLFLPETDWESMIYILITLIFFSAVVLIFFEIAVFAYKNSFSDFETKRYFIIYFGGVLITVVGLIGYLEARDVELNSSKEFSRILLDDNSQIVTDKNNFYIGKTKSYFFLYHKKDKSYKAFPTSRIKSITLNLPLESNQKNIADSISKNNEPSVTLQKSVPNNKLDSLELEKVIDSASFTK